MFLSGSMGGIVEPVLVHGIARGIYIVLVYLCFKKIFLRKGQDFRVCC